MENITVRMPYAVLCADAVSGFFQGSDLILKFFPVLVQYGWGHQVKSVLQHSFGGRVSQNIQGGGVDADQTRTVQRMTHNAAVHRGKECFQRLIFADEFPGISAFLRHIDSDAHRSHDTPVQIVQGGFVGGEGAQPLAGLYGFFGNAGLFGLHHNALRFDAGGVILLHIPDVRMASSLYLGFGFSDSITEAVVYLFMDSVFILKPDQIGRVVDNALQIMAGLPAVIGDFTILLPAQKVKAQFRLRHGKSPDVLHFRQTVRQAFHLFFFGEQDQLGVRLFLCDQRPQYGGDIYTPQICQNDIGFGGQIFLGIAALLKRMDKRFQRRHSF